MKFCNNKLSTHWIGNVCGLLQNFWIGVSLGSIISQTNWVIGIVYIYKAIKAWIGEIHLGAKYFGLPTSLAYCLTCDGLMGVHSVSVVH